jgi:hypothetical protein
VVVAEGARVDLRGGVVAVGEGHVLGGPGEVVDEGGEPPRRVVGVAGRRAVGIGGGRAPSAVFLDFLRQEYGLQINKAVEISTRLKTAMLEI